MATDGGRQLRPWLRVGALLGALGIVAGLVAFTVGDEPQGGELTTAAGGDASSSTTAPDPTTTLVVNTTGSTAPTTSTSTTSTTEEPTPTSVPVTVLYDDGSPPEPPPESPAPTHRGQAVDAAGSPLAGIFVYDSGNGIFRSDAIAVTGADGTYEVPCPRHSLVLWGVGPDYYSIGSPEQNWSKAVAGTIRSPTGPYDPPPCFGPDGPTLVTTMQRGAVLTGVLRDAEGQPMRDRTGLSLTIRQPPVSHSVHRTDSSGRYWQYGLSPGETMLSNMGTNPITVQLVADEVTAVDWTVDEDNGLVPTSPGTMP